MLIQITKEVIFDCVVYKTKIKREEKEKCTTKKEF